MNNIRQAHNIRLSSTVNEIGYEIFRNFVNCESVFVSLLLLHFFYFFFCYIIIIVIFYFLIAAVSRNKVEYISFLISILVSCYFKNTPILTE